MKTLLDECRRRFTPLPGPAGARPARSCASECPGCWFPYDLMLECDLLLNAGRVVWGCRVQANRAMYEPGDEDLPGMSLWSPDPYYDDRPGDLAAVAKLLQRWKGTATPPEPAAAEVVRILADENDHVIRLPLPPSLTGGREAYMGVTVFHRRGLPAGFLVERTYPLLVWPARCDAHMVLPLKYWPPALAAQSRAMAAEKGIAAAAAGPAAAAPGPPPLPAGRAKPTAVPPPLPTQKAAADPEAARAYLRDPIRLTPAAANEFRAEIADHGLPAYTFVRAR